MGAALPGGPRAAKTSHNRSFVGRCGLARSIDLMRPARERAAARGSVRNRCPEPTYREQVVKEVRGTARAWRSCWATRGCDARAELQVDELNAAACFWVWSDYASGVLDRRPQLEEVLGQLRPGNTLVVWRLDRLGRSLRHLIEVVTGLDERGAGFRSLRQSIDTTTAGGRLVFHLFGALAQFRAGDHPGPDGGRADRGTGPRAGRGRSRGVRATGSLRHPRLTLGGPTAGRRGRGRGCSSRRRPPAMPP